MKRKTVIAAVLLVALLLIWPIAWKLTRDRFSGDVKRTGMHADHGITPVLFGTLPTDRADASLSGKRIVAGIVPHHLLAAPYIAEFFSELAESSVVPDRIILVGPNHYERGRGRIIVGCSDWNTPFGVAAVDDDFADRLAETGVAVSDDRTLDEEHSLYSVIPFIRRYLPDASIVPIAVSGTLTREESFRLGAGLASLSDERTVFVGSLDFSHYLPSVEADRMDAETVSAIRSGDMSLIASFGNDHLDSPPTMLAAIAFAGARGAETRSPLILRHTNSGVISDRVNAPGTSHYTMAFPFKEHVSGIGAVSDSRSETRLLFGGDMMFDQWIRTVVRTKGSAYPLAPLRETFLGVDAVIANLEGPITTNDSVSETSEIGSRDNYVFTFDPSVATMLKDFNIVANIGNNHILNFKEAGAMETEKYLHDTGVGYFGTPTAGESRIFVKDIRGFRIAFVNYNQFVSGGAAKALEDIKAAKGEADFVVLYAHWGTEYVPVTDRVKELAHEFIDAGADLVIGSHPHVVQEHEVYNGKTVYYSLGNLVFDQYEKDETKNGLLVSVVIDPKTRGYEISEKPVIMGTNGQTRIREQTAVNR